MKMNKNILLLIILIVSSFSAYGQGEKKNNQSIEAMESKINVEYRNRINSGGSGVYSSTIFEDIPDMMSWGIGYAYNKTYPLTIQANYQVSYFSCGLDLGVGFNKNPQYETPSKTLKTNFQATLSPGVFLKYVSINFGVGCAFATTKTNVITITDVSSENISTSASVSYSTTTVTGRLLLKPSITGYIPVDDDEHYITISAGYNFAPNYKAINGFVFGLGFQFPLDY